MVDEEVDGIPPRRDRERVRKRVEELEERRKRQEARRESHKKGKPRKQSSRFNPARAEEWQGAPIINYSKRFYFVWDKEQQRYFPHSRNPQGDIKGLYFTFFSAVGAYAIPGRVRSGAPYFYSTDLLGRAVFRSNDFRTRQGINPGRSRGNIKFARFDKEMNDILGTDNWLTAYREVDFRYERGMAVHYFQGDTKVLKKWVFPFTQLTFRSFTKKRHKEIDKQRRK